MPITPLPLPTLKYLSGYSADTQTSVHKLLAQGRLGDMLAAKYPRRHEVQTDRALYDYAMGLKSRYLRSTEPLNKVIYDNRLSVIAHALGTHTTVARVQGGRLKAKREIRVASLFKEVAPEFLRMIMVHELAHLKEREHGKAFYHLCTHMEPDYHQLEFDLRLHLTQLDGA